MNPNLKFLQRFKCLEVWRASLEDYVKVNSILNRSPPPLTLRFLLNKLLFCISTYDNIFFLWLFKKEKALMTYNISNFDDYFHSVRVFAITSSKSFSIE